ncbi:MAG: hypothetical protein HPY81_07220 [Firmicutes bacterium]|nr:hypothetical protein [Bacillota bacterium]
MNAEKPFNRPQEALVFVLNAAVSANRIYGISLNEALSRALLWANISQKTGEYWIPDLDSRFQYIKRKEKLVAAKKCVKCGRALGVDYARKICPDCLDRCRMRNRKERRTNRVGEEAVPAV